MPKHVAQSDRLTLSSFKTTVVFSIQFIRSYQ